MVHDHLKLNDDKTEFLLIGTKQQLAKVNIGSITVGNDVVPADICVRNLGSWFDSTPLSMSTHITKVCGAAFYHLRNIRRIRNYLSNKNTKTLAHAFITWRLV